MKVNVDANILKELGQAAIRNGTEKYFISVATEWAEKAQHEIIRLNKLLEKKDE